MTRLRPQLAKLTPPRLHNAVARERLFDAVDEARQCPIVWVTGPPGAGKTTLVASYARARNANAIWCQLDRGDADAATFFYFLQQAVLRGLALRAAPLPLLTPEYRSDLPGFARRWFRTLFTDVDADSILVLDNYQEIDPDSVLHGALARALEEIPAGPNVVIVSRTDPPPAYARLLASESIARLGWEELRLTLEETDAVARVRVQVDSAMLRTLFDLSGGWAAGVTLLLEQVRRDGALSQVDGTGPREFVFDYFAHQIFEAELQGTRDLLLRTALFPNFTATLAVAISGNADAPRILESLHRRRLFIERRQGGETSYQYHALFHAFLRSLLPTRYTADEIDDLVARTAALLRTTDRSEEAFPLYVQTEDWDSAAELLTEHAPSLIGQGRLQAVADWADRLPVAVRAGKPWVEYWTAMALQPVHPSDADRRLVQVFDAFRRAGDATGQMIAAAGILDTLYTEFADFGRMDPWIDVLADFLASEPVFPTPESELRTHLSFVGTVYRSPAHPLLAHCARRVEALLELPFDVNLKVVAAQRLGAYADAATDLDLWNRVAASIAPLLDASALTPANATRYLEIAAYHHYLAWQVDESVACYERAREIAQREGLSNANLRASVYLVLCKRRAGRLASAEQTLAELEAIPKPTRGATLAVYQHTKALVAYTRGDLTQALEFERAALATVLQSGNLQSEVVLSAFHAAFLIAAGDLDTAARYLDRARTLAEGTAIDTARAYIALHEAHLAHLQGDFRTRGERLREALQFGRHRGGIARLRWAPEAMAVLLPVALEEGIEPERVGALIREFGIAPPSLVTERWPWPVKIYTLGSFSVRVHDEPISFGRKVPRKLLALLQAIIAFGSNEVPEQQLVDAIWPDEDGDTGHRLFRVALHRLRKLLGSADLIRQSAKSVTIDRNRCWVDAWAFEALLRNQDLAQRDCRAAIELYRGHFLSPVEDATWLVAARARLRGRFTQAATSHGHALESEARFDDAIAHYQRSLDIDALAEPLYQGLMRCYDRLDRHSEAVATYGRLRQALSVTLGVPPSAQSERLYASVRPA
jgi:DNA-binding SARP family transcriptional activator